MKEKFLERKGAYKELVNLSDKLETSINRVINVTNYNMKPSPQSLIRVNKTAQAIINEIWSFSKEYYEEDSEELQELKGGIRRIRENIKNAWKNIGSASARKVAFEMKPYQDLLEKVVSFLSSVSEKADQGLEENLIRGIHSSIGIEVGPYRKKEEGGGLNSASK